MLNAFQYPFTYCHRPPLVKDISSSVRIIGSEPILLFSQYNVNAVSYSPCSHLYRGPVCKYALLNGDCRWLEGLGWARQIDD